jgi:hypothetical protein
MKIVINREYGGFSLPEEFCTQYNMERYEDIDRTDERLINFVEDNGGEVKVFCGTLEITEIPDTATDWEIFEYDGLETVIYVLDGKIHHA